MTKITATAPARGRRSKADMSAALEAANAASLALSQKQQQAAAKPATAPKKAPAADKTVTAPAGAKRGAGRQKQDAGAPATPSPKQGATTAGKVGAPPELRGGIKNVLITEEAIGSRGGRKGLPEAYPFDIIAPARKNDQGHIVGQSFFIPDTDNGASKVAAARRRHKTLFWTTKTKAVVDGKEVEGIRVWRGTENLMEDRIHT